MAVTDTHQEQSTSNSVPAGMTTPAASPTLERPIPWASQQASETTASTTTLWPNYGKLGNAGSAGEIKKEGGAGGGDNSTAASKEVPGQLAREFRDGVVIRLDELTDATLPRSHSLPLDDDIPSRNQPLRSPSPKRPLQLVPNHLLLPQQDKRSPLSSSNLHESSKPIRFRQSNYSILVRHQEWSSISTSIPTYRRRRRNGSLH